MTEYCSDNMKLGAIDQENGNVKGRGSVKFDERQLKVLEHEAIFEEVVAELEYEDTDDHQKPQRRGSLQSVSTASSTSSLSVSDLHQNIGRVISGRKPRRHSTFHSSDRNFHRRQHMEMKEYFLDNNHHKRSSIIEGLFQFQLSVNLSMASIDSMENLDSPALYRSCPILSYMNDDDEDSVELQRMKRPSLTSINDDADYELSDEEDVEPSFSKGVAFKSKGLASGNRSYTVKLGGIDNENEKPRAKKRTTSYAMLSQRLDEHPLSVLEDIRSASMSNLPMMVPKKPFMSDSPALQRPPSKKLMTYKMSHDEDSFTRDNKDLMATTPPPPLIDPRHSGGAVGRAA